MSKTEASGVTLCSPRAILALVFCSGYCALVYQVTWFREFRLIFGASTPATAAVMAIFMGGLGLGSAWLGKRADAKQRPLLFYGKLELGIGLLAILTPCSSCWCARYTWAPGEPCG